MADDSNTPSPAEPDSGRPRNGVARGGSGAGRDVGAPRRPPGRERERQGAAGDERRRKRPAGQRAAGDGFGDAIERAFCAAASPLLPETFPVQSRHDVATLLPAIVDRRAGALLFCDGQHPGPHFWPDGDAVDLTLEPWTPNPPLPEDSAVGDAGVAPHKDV
jgi:hypothetical protein